MVSKLLFFSQRKRYVQIRQSPTREGPIENRAIEKGECRPPFFYPKKEKKALRKQMTGLRKTGKTSLIELIDPDKNCM